MQEIKGLVLQNIRIAEDTFEITLQLEDQTALDEFVPGQFAHIRISQAQHLLLRRPISIHAIDIESKQVVLQYVVVGKGTFLLSKASSGETIDATMPIGQGFNLQNFKKQCIDGKQPKLWLLGGGIGIAPLYSIVQNIPHANWSAFLGWRDVSHVYDIPKWENSVQLNAYTDDGSFGLKGFAINGLMQKLQRETPDQIFACGPKPMLRALLEQLPKEIPCQVSLEEKMGCGVGACLVCVCKIKAEQEGFKHKRVCVDGPVFDLQEVIFS